MDPNYDDNRGWVALLVIMCILGAAWVGFIAWLVNTRVMP